MSKINKIVLIPPNGEMFVNDFSLQRIGKALKVKNNIKIILLKIDKSDSKNIFEKTDFADITINVKSKDELFNQLKIINPDTIFHRSWMLAYPFAAKLVKEFDNVVVNIKDWNFSSEKDYKIIFGEKSMGDFDAIKYIFKNAKLVLSHFIKEQALIWAKEYKTDKDKFIFFPEYCDKDKFFNRKNTPYKKHKLVFAGSLGPTSDPQEFFLAKPHLMAIRTIAKKDIFINYVLSPGTYAGIKSEKQKILFQDILYENKFNKNFNIKKGKVLDSSILKNYTYGIFTLEYTVKNEHLNKYAIPSKFAFYLEAGIPLLVNKKLVALSQYVEKYNLGITFSNSDLANLHKILKQNEPKYNKFIKNIKKFRENFTYKEKYEF